MGIAVGVSVLCLLVAGLLALIGSFWGAAEGPDVAPGEETLGYDQGLRSFTRAMKWTAPRLAVAAGLALIVTGAIAALR
jgi:hypothetical protein